MITKKALRDSIKIMVSDFGNRDPRRGVWEYIKQFHPELWRDHQTALLEIDNAYQVKDAGRVLTAKSAALDTFNRMIETWAGANEQMKLTGRAGA